MCHETMEYDCPVVDGDLCLQEDAHQIESDKVRLIAILSVFFFLYSETVVNFLLRICFFKQMLRLCI